MATFLSVSWPRQVSSLHAVGTVSSVCLHLLWTCQQSAVTEMTTADLPHGVSVFESSIRDIKGQVRCTYVYIYIYICMYVYHSYVHIIYV